MPLRFAGGPSVAHTSIDLDQIAPKIVPLVGGSWMLLWEETDPNDPVETDPYARIFDAEGIANGVETSLQPADGPNIIRVDYELIDRTTLLNTVLFEGEVDPSLFSLSAQLQPTATGATSDLIFLIEDSAFFAEELETTVLADGGWLVSWRDVDDGNKVYQSRFDATGTELVSPQLITSQASFTEFYSDTEALSSGGWVTTWWASGIGVPFGSYMRVFDANGTTVTPSLLLSEDAINGRIAELEDGGWVVVYQGLGLENGVDQDSDIYMHRFAADGTELISQMRVNEIEPFDQEEPEVVGLADGGWVVVWDDRGSFSPDTFSSTELPAQIRLQRYAEDGTKIGNNVVVSDLPNVVQTNPAMELLEDGRLALSWQAENYAAADSGSDIVTRVVGFPDIEGVNQPETLSGDGEDNVIWALGGGDNVNGLGGDDTILGGFGNDTINGGGQDDYVAGEGGADVLFGGSGNDTVTGGTSNDSLFGGSGFDWMDGGENSDVYFVDGGDTVFDSGQNGFDKAQINNAAGETLRLDGWGGIERINGFSGNDIIDASMIGDFENLVISGDGGNDEILGGAGSDILLGGAGDDTIKGGDGDDTILGGTENDSMEGGAGNDVFFVGESGDVVADGGTGFDKAVINNAAGLSIDIGSWVSVERMNGFTGNDTIDATGLDTDIAIASSGGNDMVIGGNGNDTVYAGSGDDDVQGGQGDDALIGSAGADTLNGGEGKDFLLGGVDADTFAFSTGWGEDVVQDFADGTDRLDFSDHAGVSGMGDLVVAQNGANTEIALAIGGADLITLVGVQSSAITSADIDFI